AISTTAINRVTRTSISHRFARSCASSARRGNENEHDVDEGTGAEARVDGRVRGGRERLRRRTVGQALRARRARGLDHVVRPGSGLERLPPPRLRGARGCARRHGQLGGRLRMQLMVRRLFGTLAALLLAAAPAFGGVLPEDRADVLYHSYDGGGVTIEGPSILVRKQFAGKFSASANYYVDKVTSAS